MSQLVLIEQSAIAEEYSMEIFDSLNFYLMQHPVMLEQLEFAFRIKWFFLLLLALVFMRLAAHGSQESMQKPTSKDDQFIA